MLPLPTELDDLNPLLLADEPRFVSAATETDQKSWLYFFPFLFSFSLGEGKTLLWERSHGAICLYFLRTSGEALRLDLYVPPFPFSLQAMAHAEERVNSFNGSRSCRVTWVDERQREWMESAGYRVRPVEQEFIYDGDRVRALSGKEFARLRRILSQTRRIPGLQVRSYRPADRRPCEELLKRWRRRLRDEKGADISGYFYTRNCLDQASSFRDGILKGEVIAIDDRICAFTFGGRISASRASIFLTISDHDVPGLGYFQRHSFIAANPDFRYFNDSSDAGRAGLAQVKRAFDPIEMHTLYRAHQAAPPG